jgi:hypothetical protein
VQSSFTRADGGGLRSAANFFLHSSARAAFRERWPLAFPTKHEDVRPLAMASPAKSPRRWGGRFPIRSASSRDGKWRRSTQAVLSHDQPIGLDGSPAELVDAEAKELATKQMLSLRRVRPRRRRPRSRARPWGSLSLARRARPKLQSNCAIECVPACCASARYAALPTPRAKLAGELFAAAGLR